MAEERGGIVTFKGNPVTLLGPEIKVGDRLPSATLTAIDLKPVSISDSNKAKLIITVPSVDTSVCSLEAKKFSDAVLTLDSSKIAVYLVSADLPFALRRWAKEEGVDNLVLLSDYRGMEMARSWGLYLKELALFARAVYVADADGLVTYREIVPEVAMEPNYAAGLEAVQATA